MSVRKKSNKAKLNRDNQRYNYTVWEHSLYG